MAISIKKDDTFGARESWSIDGGKEIVRAWKITGLTPSAGMGNAMDQAIGAAGLKPGTEHPTLKHLIVERLDVEPIQNSPTMARLMVKYLDTSLIHVTINGTLLREMTHWAQPDTDDGPLQFIRVGWNPTKQGEPNYFPKYEAQQPGDKFHPGQLEGFFPSPTLEFRYYFKGSPLPQLSGRINRTRWQGGEPGTWICTDSSSRLLSETRGPLFPRKAGSIHIGWYEYRLSFQWKGFNNDSWIPYAYFEDPNTRNMPPHVKPKPPSRNYLDDRGNGYRRYRMQGVSEFHDLKLPEVLSDMTIVRV